MPEWLETLTEDKHTFYACLRVLYSHGLVDATPTTTSEYLESRGYSVHGYVHSWMIHVLNRKYNSEIARVAIECVAAYMPGRYYHEFWLIQRRLIAHADKCLEAIRDTDSSDKDL